MDSYAENPCADLDARHCDGTLPLLRILNPMDIDAVNLIYAPSVAVMERVCFYQYPYCMLAIFPMCAKQDAAKSFGDMIGIFRHV